MLTRVLLLFALILVVGFAPAPFPKKQRAESLPMIQRMQGWWKIIDEVSNGAPGRNEKTSQLRLLVKGDTMTYYNAESAADGWTIVINESTRPPELDKIQQNSPKGTKPSYHGRVSLDGGVLTVNWTSGTSPRPDDLSGRQSTAIRFRRE